MSENIERTIHSIISLSKRYARKKLRPEDLEDFASFCVEYYLKTGRRLKPTQALAEFARQNLGRTGTARSNANAKMFSIDDVEIAVEYDASSLHEMFSSGVARLLVFLIEKYGFTQREIADIMRVHESRVSQIIDRAIERVAAEHRGMEARSGLRSVRGVEPRKNQKEGVCSRD